MSRTEHQTPSGRCRYGIGTDDDALFVCPLTGEMVKFGIFSGRHGARGTEVRSHSWKPRCRMPTILVVDDEDQIRQLICETLEQAGYHVTEARDGKEGLQQYRLSPADLVVMDILMPDQDSLETIVTLRRKFPNVKVIAITGGSDMIGILNFLDVAKMLGAHSTLQKPFEMKPLLDTVQAEL
jgi:two-component system chemotaxis response regulator CheY